MNNPFINNKPDSYSPYDVHLRLSDFLDGRRIIEEYLKEEEPHAEKHKHINRVLGKWNLAYARSRQDFLKKKSAEESESPRLDDLEDGEAGCLAVK
jgi:hypothetical protein